MSLRTRLPATPEVTQLSTQLLRKGDSIYGQYTDLDRLAVRWQPLLPEPRHLALVPFHASLPRDLCPPLATPAARCPLRAVSARREAI